MHLKELKAFLTALGARPKKGLSQNFLVDHNIITKLLNYASVKKGDYVLEIGAGPGAITEILVKREADVVAVELDTAFAEALKRFPITIYAEDILVFSLDSLERRAKVVANLPYHITAPILGRLLPRRDLFSTLTLVVQEEVARRMVAQPKTSDYSSLTLFLQFYAEVDYAFRISRHCFYPAPKVDSAVVHLVLREPPPVHPDPFFLFVRTAFQQRRKMLKNTLTSLYEKDLVETALKHAGINPKARPEELSLDAYLALFSYLS